MKMDGNESMGDMDMGDMDGMMMMWMWFRESGGLLTLIWSSL